jgi:hypothetical protein
VAPSAAVAAIDRVASDMLSTCPETTPRFGRICPHPLPLSRVRERGSCFWTGTYRLGRQGRTVDRPRIGLFRFYGSAEGQNMVCRSAGRCRHRDNGLVVGLEDFQPTGQVRGGAVEGTVNGEAQRRRQECAAQFGNQFLCRRLAKGLAADPLATKVPWRLEFVVVIGRLEGDADVGFWNLPQSPMGSVHSATLSVRDSACITVRLKCSITW